MGIVRSEILCGRSNSMQEYYCWQLSGLNLLRREFYILLLFFFRSRQISYGGMSQGGNCRVVFITVASVHFVSIRIVVSDKSMVRKFYDPNKNTKYFKHTFLTHLFPPFQHLLSERLTSLGQQMLELGCENVSRSDGQSGNRACLTECVSRCVVCRSR